ncbi:MAG: PEGA domain-containing protein [Spirochaetales bacterium]|nr:PEGA domain-containing protein [Spirochaetales bacterium]
MRKTNVYLGLCFVFLSGMAVILGSCSSMPLPDKAEDSLFCVLAGKAGETDGLISLGGAGKITFTGPEIFSFDLKAGEDIILRKKIPAGEYAISFDREIEKTPFPAAITVEAGSVTFFQFYFLFDGKTVYTRYVSNIERKKTLALLSDFIGFENWFGFRYIGFENLKPKMFLGNRTHVLAITGSPMDASVLIDGDSWGTLPFSEEFSDAKYTVEIIKKGYEPVRKLVDLTNDISLKIDLKPAKAGTPLVVMKDFRIMVIPFQSRSDDGENPYGNLFPGSFSVTFRNNRRLEILDLGGAVNIKASIEPDFSVAEEAGADLVITGEYYFEGEHLYIHPVLWDVKSERIKYSNTFISPAGFSVFTAVDNMAEEFSREVSRVLPEAGEPIVEKEEIVTEGMIDYEKKLFVDNVLTERAAESSFIYLSGGMGGTMDNIMAEDYMGGIDSLRKNDGPGFMVRIGYMYMFTKDLGITVNVMGCIGELHSQDAMTNYEFPNPYFDFFLFSGLTYIFATPTADLYFVVGPAAGYMPAVDYINEATNMTLNSHYYAGLNMEVGYRFYFQDNVSRKPFYMTLGLMLDLIQFQFGDIDGVHWVPIQFNLFVGGGLVL